MPFNFAVEDIQLSSDITLVWLSFPSAWRDVFSPYLFYGLHEIVFLMERPAVTATLADFYNTCRLHGIDMPASLYSFLLGNAGVCLSVFPN
jgi:hypothetical protein